MHAALRKVLGPHVQQKGSLVDPWKTRFDFSHNAPLTPEEIREIEQLVNDEIRRNVAVEPRLMKYDEAIKAGAMALFGEKYGDDVRVIGMGDFSTELCGGTHVRRTGDIGFFKIVSQVGVAAGIRRVEAVTADGALAWVQQQNAQVEGVADMLKVQPTEVGAAAHADHGQRARSGEGARHGSNPSSRPAQGDDLAEQAVDGEGAKVLAATLDGADAKTLRETMDKLKDKLKSRRHRAGLGGCRQGDADRGRDQRSDREGQGRRAGELRRAAGRRQGRRPAGHGAGRRHRSEQIAAGARVGSRLGARARGVSAAPAECKL